MKESVVTIKGSRYKYAYDSVSGEMKYLGPVGDSQPMSEGEFTEFLAHVWGSTSPGGFASTKEQKKKRGERIGRMRGQFHKRNFDDLETDEQKLMNEVYDDLLLFMDWHELNTGEVPKVSEHFMIKRRDDELIDLEAKGLLIVWQSSEPDHYNIKFTENGLEMMKEYHGHEIRALREWEL